jgi:hypothetical protein
VLDGFSTPSKKMIYDPFPFTADCMGKFGAAVYSRKTM